MEKAVLSDSQTAKPTTITTFTGFCVILVRKRVWALQTLLVAQPIKTQH